MGEDVAEDAQLYHKLWNENTGVDFEELEKESVSEPFNFIFFTVLKICGYFLKKLQIDYLMNCECQTNNM